MVRILAQPIIVPLIAPPPPVFNPATGFPYVESLPSEILIARRWFNPGNDPGATFPLSAPSLTPSSPITITSSNTLIEYKSFTATTSNGPLGARTIFITTSGSSAASPYDNITIRHCTFSGGTISIWLKFCTNITIEDCIFTDPDYAAIDLWSCIHGYVQRNTIQRVGYTRTDFSDPAFGNNAYGIVTNRNESNSLVGDPRTRDILFYQNLIEDVPLWMGFNTHGGQDLVIDTNTIRRCVRLIFLASSPMAGGGSAQPINLTVQNNTLEAPVSKAGGSPDLEGILYASIATIYILNNGIGYNTVDPHSGGTIGSPGYFDFGNASTGEVISGNFLI